MAWFKKEVKIGKRTIHFKAHNKISKSINDAAIYACVLVLRQYPFIFIPHLEIILEGKISLETSLFNVAIEEVPQYGSIANVRIEEIVNSNMPKMHINIDLILTKLIVKAQRAGTLNSQYLKYLKLFNIPAEDKNLFIDAVRDSIIHEGTHILHILSSYNFRLQNEALEQLDTSLKKYAIYGNIRERDIIKLTREMSHDKDSEEFVTDEKTLAERLFKDTRYNIKLFLDLLFQEGIAIYAQNQNKYPFEVDFLQGQYGSMVQIIEKQVMYYIDVVIQVAGGLSEKIVGEKRMQQLPTYDKKQIQGIHKRFLNLGESLRISSYALGPHMVYTTLFGNEDVSLFALMKMNSFEFTENYEKACSHLGIRPLVSLTSGHGIFDYKKVLERWTAEAKFFRKI